MTIEELATKIKSLNLPLDHMAIMGGWCLFLHDLRTSSPNDVDFIADTVGWQAALNLGQPEETNLKTGQVIKLDNGFIEIYDSWAPGEWNTQELIDTAEEVDGVRFVNLSQVLRWKKLMNRPKDAEDVQKLEQFLTKSV